MSNYWDNVFPNQPTDTQAWTLATVPKAWGMDSLADYRDSVTSPYFGGGTWNDWVGGLVKDWSDPKYSGSDGSYNWEQSYADNFPRITGGGRGMPRTLPSIFDLTFNGVVGDRGQGQQFKADLDQALNTPGTKFTNDDLYGAWLQQAHPEAGLQFAKSRTTNGFDRFVDGMVMQTLGNFVLPGFGTAAVVGADGNLSLGDIAKIGYSAFSGSPSLATNGTDAFPTTGPFGPTDYSKASLDYSSNPALNTPNAISSGPSLNDWMDHTSNIPLNTPSYNYSSRATPMNFDFNSTPSISNFDFSSGGDFPSFDLGGLGNINYTDPSVFSGFSDLWNKFKGSDIGKMVFSGKGNGINPFLKSGAGFLANMYSMNQANKAYRDQRSQIQKQVQGLNDLYSPNSPYAQQMRQQLERADAAAGRRSQYGNREVQLAANLSDSAARNRLGVANTMASAGVSQLNSAINKNRAAGLLSAGQFLGDNSWNMNDVNNLYSGLQGLF